MITRRIALGVAAAALATPALAQDNWPSRPIRLVVPYAPGGTTDLLGRFVAERVGREIGQTVVVENRPGANTIIGSQAVAQAQGDGYTLLMASGASMVINPMLYRRLPYNPDQDLTLLAALVDTPLAMVVPPSLPAQNLQEFVALAKRGGVNSASVGIGNPIHLAAEMFSIAAGVELTNVVYPGSTPALTALMAGDVQVMFDVILTSLPFIQSGRLRCLAVTTKERVPALRDTPTIAEQGFPGYEAGTWFGVAAPRSVPKPITDKLRDGLAAVQRDSAFHERFGTLGLVIQPVRDEAALGQMIEAERNRWSGIIRSRNITLD
ncbi:tripartite tricarboxylate transporter substrate binding protein [Rhodovarius crocodyli]|uniref:Tripartite tricarboxylate transporter substrate binding protein n=1 Tax=Rhodovarius crocodyli TaxID=1979269 RepID=A0A437MML6_9PROT|nr:tripartite tricarboxylate transporter substrate binding protein [Rhodovarius crocodyli]RVT98873.1 tripartite tricarboxylate transporter substrate binding protein [Rhodovarius crocodyli]